MRNLMTSICMSSALLLPLACGRSASSAPEAATLADSTQSNETTEGAVTLKAKDQELRLTQTLPAGVGLTSNLVAPFTIIDSETRQQTWKHCGFLGTEICREWKQTKTLASSALDATHLKVQVLVNGAELVIENPSMDVVYESSNWANGGELVKGVLPLDELLGDPFFAAQKNFKFAMGDSDLALQGRLISAKGNLLVSPSLSAFGEQDLKLEIIITKTSETGVILVYPQAAWLR